jgi:hypothetical protein
VREWGGVVMGIFWGVRGASERHSTFAGIIVDRDSAGRDVGGLWGVRDVAEDYAFGETIADFESRHFGWIV